MNEIKALAHTLAFKDIQPFIRLSQYKNITPDDMLGSYRYEVKSYDYRLFYIIGGSGIFKINNTGYSAEKGCLYYWQPGMRYRILPAEQSHLEFLQLNFDFTYGHSNISYPVVQSKTECFEEHNIVELVHFTDFEEFNQPLALKNMNCIEDNIVELKNEFVTRKKFYDQKICALTILIFNAIARTISSIEINPLNKGHKIDKIIKYVHDNYNSNISNISIGRLFNYHPNYISRLIFINTGMTLHQYLLQHRISEVIDLIQNSDITITEAAYTVGFNSLTHFSKQFKKMTGRNPISFRKI